MSQETPLIVESASPKMGLSTADAEFRSETIYFIVVDRFCDGNQHNVGRNDALNDPEGKDWGKYWGGDLQGVLDKLDYLQSIGVTAIWFTPLFEQIESFGEEGAPIHGYWTSDFKRINERWVNSPEEVRLFTRRTVLDDLIEEMHRRGMKFILDIVCNHSTPRTDLGKGKLYDDGELVADFENDEDHWYHHYGPVSEWSDEWQVKNCEIAGLATFNENNIRYRRYITSAINAWIDKGVDALRVDTVKHMPLWFWQEVISAWQMRKPDLFVFGEWIDSHPENALSVEYANKSGMALLDFALCHAIRDCLAQGSEAGFAVVQGVFDQDCQYQRATELVTFYENHDMPRFQSVGGSVEALRLATVLIMTCRGIPCIYYGVEQYLHNDHEGGDDPYNRPMMERWDETDMGQLLARLGDERKKSPAIQCGAHRERYLSRDSYAYTRTYRDSRCFVAMNKGEAVTLTDVLTELEDGVHQCVLSGREFQVEDGKLPELELQQNEAIVLSHVGTIVSGTVVVDTQVNGLATEPGERIAVIGSCPELGEWDLERAVQLEYINGNTWAGQLIFNESAGSPVAYKYVLFSAHDDASPQRENCTPRRRLIPGDGRERWSDIWVT